MPMKIRHWNTYAARHLCGQPIRVWVYCNSWKKAAALVAEAIGSRDLREPERDYRVDMDYRKPTPSEYERIGQDTAISRSQRRDDLLAENPNVVYFEAERHSNALTLLNAENLKAVR